MQYRGIEKYPTLTYQELTDRYDELERGVTKITTSSQYFEAQYQIALLEGSALKLEQTSLVLDPRYPRTYMRTRIRDLGEKYLEENEKMLREHKTNYSDAFYSDNFEKVRDEGAKKIQGVSLAANQEIDWQTFWLRAVWWGSWYIFISRLFACIHYMLKHRTLGNSSVLAFFDFRFPRAVLGFEYYVWKYPVQISPVEQFKRAYQLATVLLGTFLSWSIGVASVFAQSKAPKEESKPDPQVWFLSGSSLVNSKYVGMDGAVFHPGEVLQSEITLIHKNGIWIDFWDSIPLTKRNVHPNYGSEQDYTIGYAKSIGDFKLNTFAMYVNVVPLLSLPRGDVLHLSGKISRDAKLSAKQTMTPYVQLHTLLPARGSTPNSGWFAQIGTHQTWMANKKVTAQSNAEVERDSGAVGLSKGFIARFSFSLNVKFGKGITAIVPSWNASTPIVPTNDGRKFESVFGFGFSFSR